MLKFVRRVLTTPIDFFGRHDVLLIAGLSVAFVVLFARPIRYLLDLARQVEEQHGLALVPALIILTLVFVFQQHAKRLATRHQAITAETEARLAHDRANEMERLVALGQALSRALEFDPLREAVWRHLPQIADDRDVWILVRQRDRWEPLIGARSESGQGVAGDLEVLAEDVLEGRAEQGSAGQPVERAGLLCFPLLVGETAVGVMGVASDGAPMTDVRRRTLAAAATLMAIAVKNVELFREIRENALQDGLTGCYTKSHALEMINTELRRARRSQTPTSLIMFDIDHFKNVNDEHGHLCGDAVLAAVGRRMREVLRGSDVKCRYGGEEFLIMLPDTPLAGAQHVAEWLRREVGQLAVAWKGGTFSVTASFGVTTALPAELEAETLIARADTALYQAKREGRNAVRVEVPEGLGAAPPSAAAEAAQLAALRRRAADERR